MIQAFCYGLNDVRKEFYTVINSAERELINGEIDATKLWFLL